MGEGRGVLKGGGEGGGMKRGREHHLLTFALW